MNTELVAWLITLSLIIYEIVMLVRHKREVTKFDAQMHSTFAAGTLTQQNYRIVEIFASYRGSPISIKLTTPDAVDEHYLDRILQVLSPTQDMLTLPYSTKDLS